MAGKTNKVLRILMERDGMTEKEACDLMSEVREMMDEAIAEGDYSEAESIFEEEFGLEPDYIFDILFM